MTFVGASLLNGVAVAVRLAAALIINKVLAVLVGPAGYALVGQLQNAISILSAFATGAIGQGVVKYTAEHHDDPAARDRLWRTAGTLTLGLALLTGLVVFAFRGALAEAFLRDRGQAFVFAALAVALAGLALNALLLAILNGLKAIRDLVVASIAGSLVTLGTTLGLAFAFGLAGALVALAIGQAVALAATLAVCWRLPAFGSVRLFGAVHAHVLRGLLRFAAMAAAGAFILPAAQLAIRSMLIDRFGLVPAGHWEAMMRVSTLYLLFFTSTLAVWYLPRIAEIREARLLAREVATVARLAMPVVALVSFLLWLLREPVVLLLFDGSFRPMTGLFGWQLFGDTLRAASWILAYVMVGKGLAAAFILLEAGFALAWVGFSLALMPHAGPLGVNMAYAWAYAVYLPATALVYRRQLRSMERKEPSTA